MDYIIKDGWIVNGKKEKPFHGDLVIENGKIAEVGTHVEIPADFPKERVLTDDCCEWKLWAFGGSGRGEIWERDCQISQQCDWGFSLGKR